MEKYYLKGRAVIPEKDILLCSVKQDDIIRPLDVPMCFTNLYATAKGTFYKVEQTAARKVICLLSKDEAVSFLEENAAYIITRNYDTVFGEPERG